MPNISKYKNLRATTEAQLSMLKRSDMDKDVKAEQRKELEDTIARLTRVIKAMSKAAKEARGEVETIN